MNQKVKVIVRLEVEHIYYHVAVLHISHNTMRTSTVCFCVIINLYVYSVCKRFLLVTWVSVLNSFKN